MVSSRLEPPLLPLSFLPFPLFMIRIPLLFLLHLLLLLEVSILAIFFFAFRIWLFLPYFIKWNPSQPSIGIMINKPIGNLKEEVEIVLLLKENNALSYNQSHGG